MGFTEHLVNPLINFSTKTVVVFLFHALKCSITLIHLGTDHKTFTVLTCKYKINIPQIQKKKKRKVV